MERLVNLDLAYYVTTDEGRGAIPKKIYQLENKGRKKAERMSLKDHFDSLVAEMDPAEIMAWLSRFKEHGLRLRFTVEMVVKDEGRKILGKVVGIWVDYKNKRGFPRPDGEFLP